MSHGSEQVKDRPIIFSAPMARALLDGRKSQTRRIVKPQPVPHEPFGGSLAFLPPVVRSEYQAVGVEHANSGLLRCRFGVPGDRLWVKETALSDAPLDGTWSGDIEWDGCGRPWRGVPEKYRSPQHVIYAATCQSRAHIRYKSSIHMPRWASRLTLTITDVRVERVQDIDRWDAYAEGISKSKSECPNPMAAFARLWNTIHGPGAWERNDWVWALTFTTEVRK